MAKAQGTAARGAERGVGVRHARLKGLALGLLCLLPVVGAVQLGWRGQGWVALALYPLASVISLLLYWRDKRQAQRNAWRTPEKVLHASELLGGWPGALVAQQLLRHKTRKLSYQLVFWGIVLVHQVFWIDYLFLGARLLPFG
ncbi:DUF1294 domain-containing protein [Pantoea sp. Tr-811]|uniref:DUF1294 domain-containing protein n=1 Tax=Pantoea sp. Tr-811 TaxID=2608361 RepID=UPI00142388A5|nr:DUF1294 domain-containing protein [Pantoea sp. Tr-811]NIF28221.1 DUF1294 domain-containing protein [Pantoea sp. Tr-811]